jgi:hypothetical protein
MEREYVAFWKLFYTERFGRFPPVGGPRFLFQFLVATVVATAGFPL